MGSVKLFMSQEQTVGVIQKLLDEIRSRSDGGVKGSADAQLELSKEMLSAVGSTGELSEDAQAALKSAMDEVASHENLGIIVRNAFQSISPSQASRSSIQAGCYISTKFLVVTLRQATEFLADRGRCQWIPADAVFDVDTGSLVCRSFWLRKNPDALKLLSLDEARALGLEIPYMELHHARAS
jgi:hypothetical protein